MAYIEMKVVSSRNNEKKVILDQWEVELEESGNIHTLEVGVQAEEDEIFLIVLGS